MPSLSRNLGEWLELDPHRTRFQVLPVGEVPGPVQATFDQLPPDEHLGTSPCYRFRSYGCGTLHRGDFSYSQNSVFSQTSQFNKLFGGVSRKFQPLSARVKTYLKNTVIETLFAPLLNPDITHDFGIHQIRIVAQDGLAGLPAPEGIHQDGFDFVSILMVGVENGLGAKCMLYDMLDADNLVLETYIPKNAILIFNDRIYKHYTTELRPKQRGKAKRDVFVLTVSRVEPHE